MDVELRAIAAHGDRLVVLGDVRPTFGSNTTYVAPLAIGWWFDGAAWTPVKISPFAEDRQASVGEVQDGFLAIIGSAPSCTGGLWDSTDGRSWSCLDDPAFEGFVVRGAVTSPDLAVLVGHSVADPVVAAAWALALH